ncbi:MAG: GNAT family N-acetyltransferase [Candidatus Methylacidiphilales bacterium]|nr:GNAT family N-acetyltransferase [Candidatus Methylacidiphilales bacterium]
MPTLYTRPLTRVSIRPVDKVDVRSIQNYASDTRLHATCNLPSPYPDGAAETFVTSARTAWQRNTQCTFAILSEEAFCGLMTLNDVRGNEGTAQLDYWVAYPQWGKGIATQAASLAIDYAFNRLFLKKLYSGALLRNNASLRVLEKNGFVRTNEHLYGGPWPERFGGEIVAQYQLLRSQRNTSV